MKKIVLASILILSFTGTAVAGDVTIKARGFYFSPTEQVFRDIYGGGMGFCAELDLGLWRGFDLWMSGGLFSRKGELTYTKEETKLRIIPAGAGLLYKFSPDKPFSFYGGLGVNYFSFTEENVIGKATKGALGPVTRVGFIYIVGGRLVIDLMFEYSYCRINPADFRINIGGISAGIGLGILL